MAAAEKIARSKEEERIEGKLDLHGEFLGGENSANVGPSQSGGQVRVWGDGPSSCLSQCASPLWGTETQGQASRLFHPKGISCRDAAGLWLNG